ncbi:hypothetical protein UY3_16300 [Chelonia mydas]|uniref:Uncharacterized protein n=1 Tax=Chelonia mydas TaxID=8469 RepID=M7APU4_CHEMY|nr:hypothetical protein UY3_16300 [Chelonia mydas]
MLNTLMLAHGQVQSEEITTAPTSLVNQTVLQVNNGKYEGKPAYTRKVVPTKKKLFSPMLSPFDTAKHVVIHS